MTSCIYRLTGKNFRKAVALFAVVLAVSSQQGAAMPILSDDSYLPALATSPDRFQVCAYRVGNTLKMRLHFINPQQKRVKILILNSNKKTVFEKDMHKRKKFVGNFDLTELPNGRYTFVVKSGNEKYSQSFSLQTQSTRIVQTN